MGLRNWLLLAALGLLTGGCVNGPKLAAPDASKLDGATGSSASGTTAESPRAAWMKAAPASRSKSAAPWEWVAALPSGVQRAETLAPTLPEASLARFLSSWPGPEIRTVSTQPSTAGHRITAVNETTVADCNQLHSLVMRALASGKQITVTVGSVDAQDTAGRTVAIEPAQLAALNQSAAPQAVLSRVTEEGNSWTVLRDDGVRCKLMTRVERRRRLLHVALGLSVCWGPQVTLPKDVRASCNGVPLQCLVVAETLEALYGDAPSKNVTADLDACSFAAVSEREDYLIPANFKRLQQAVDAAAEKSGAPPRQPALASVPGLSYPGPALLGDARALAAFLLQRQLYQVGEPERVGWLIFAGDTLSDGSIIEIDIDLGSGPRRLTFNVPRS